MIILITHDDAVTCDAPKSTVVCVLWCAQPSHFRIVLLRSEGGLGVLALDQPAKDMARVTITDCAVTA